MSKKSKKFDKTKLDELFDIKSKGTLSTIEEFEKTIQQSSENLSSEIITNEEYTELSDIYKKLLNETREFIEMVKQDIRIGHYETEDQRTSLYDSASKLLDNLNRLINNIIVRENNYQRNEREIKKLQLSERELNLKEFEIKRKLELKEKELENISNSKDNDNSPKKLEQHNYYLTFNEIIKEIEKTDKDIIEISNE